MNSPIEAFRSAMSAAGLSFSGPICPDGKIHRVNCEGQHGISTWYVLHQSEKFAAGCFGDWRTQVKQPWNSANGTPLSPDERREMQRLIADAEFQRKTEEEKLRAEAKAKAQQALSAGTVPASHPYLERKKVKVHGELRVSADGLILLPLRDIDGSLHSLQFIAPDKRFSNNRDKDFIFGGQIKSHFFTICDKPDGPLIICEGYATGASDYEATGWATVCAMFANNLQAVALAFRKKYPTRTIIIAADNDRFTENNPGLTSAKAAAQAAKAFVAIPEFDPYDTASTDFNDLASISGKESVVALLHKAIPIMARPIGDLLMPIENDPSELLKNRFLCRKMGLLFVGSTGKGKSTFLLQCLALWSIGKPCFGITPVRPMRSVYVQAENDDGDIAQIRDGICRGLNLSESERKQFFANVLVFSEASISGMRFCNEVLRPILDLHRPDLLTIDPALAYLGGDAKEQRDVGIFLRNYLQPLLVEFDCAVMINHHTNKISSLADADDSTPDFSYFGSGSSEWANWPRAILALETTKTKGVFKLHAAKRGQKLAWKNAEDEIVYHQLIAHSKDASTIYWRDADEDEVPVKQGRGLSYDPVALTDLLKDKSLPTVIWQKMAKDELGIPEKTFYRAIKDLTEVKKVFKSKLDRKWNLVTAKTGYQQD